MPFARTYAETFAKRVRGAAFKHKIEGGGDGSTVTLDTLRDTFRTPAWTDIELDDSRITKLISSNVFKNKNGQILADSLILFGVLNCGGDAKCKSEALYGVLQEGGVAKSQFISANDKDIMPAINKLVQLCTMDLVTLMQEVDEIHPMDLEENQDDIDYVIDEILEENYLDPLYGEKSRLTYLEWLHNSSNKKEVARVFYEP